MSILLSRLTSNDGAFCEDTGIPTRARQEVGRPITLANSALNRGRQTRSRPNSGEDKVAPRRRRTRTLRILRRRRCEGRAALAHDLPWRDRTWKAGYGCDLLPDLPGESFTRKIEQAVGTADGHG